MKKIFLLTLILTLLITGIAAAEEQYIIRLTVTPFVSKVNGLQKDTSYELKMSSGQSTDIDLRIFTTAMTIEKYGDSMAFTFDHDLEMLSGAAVIETHRIILEKYAIAHLCTPTMDAGAWLAVSWGSDEIPMVYQDFINSISSIYKGVESGRYGSYEDYSIMFSVQSGWEKENKTLGYTVMDIDGDGTDELLFGEMHADLTGTPIYDLYTIENNELVHIFDGWDRNRYYLTTDGGFMRQGSNSAFNSFTSYYAYGNGKLQLLRSVIYDSNRNSSAPWFLSYITEMDASSAQSITESEAKTIMSYYTGKQIELTPFP